MQALINEIRAHWILEQCEGVLKTLAIYDNEEYVIVALEYQAKGSLMQSLEDYKKFTEVEVRVIMEQLLLVLDFFQKKKIVHRDIKPDNILITVAAEGVIRLKFIDFADMTILSLVAGWVRPPGTKEFMAPERASQMMHAAEKTDIFSLGATIMTMLYLNFPFGKGHGCL